MTDDSCSPTAAEVEEEAVRLIDLPALRAAAIAGILLVAGFAAGRLGAEPVQVGGYVLALAVGGWTFVPEALRNLLRRRINIGTLMAVAAAGAVILGEVGEAASLAFLFSISEALEAFALARARHSLRALLSIVPDTATVVRDGAERQVDVDELVPGDVMFIRPGERVPTDGVIRHGRTAIDTSPVTGESVPLEAGPGDAVFAGSINGNGTIDVEVVARSTENSLARVVHIVEEAQERKGQGQRIADRFARPLVPGVIVLATAIALIGSLAGDPGVWIERSLVVLVAAAPCALAISVPVAVFAAIGAASRGGVLVKGGLALETLGKVKVVALDKTGTLTRGRPRVILLSPAPGRSESELLWTAASVESRSEHPLARAIVEAAAGNIADATDVTAVVGNGVLGVLDGKRVRLGRPGFIEVGPLAAQVADAQAGGATVVLVEVDHELLGLIAVRDELRPEAVAAAASLRGMGLELAMLSGDNRATATALAREAGIDQVYAELRPEEKAEVVRQLQQRGAVAMVGDGINDAPALATADVGIAMGAMGTDVAIETADVALMGEDLRHLPQAIEHARRSVRIMHQNLFLSASILIVLVPLAAFGVLGLAAVVAAHEVAEVVVIANGVRAARLLQLVQVPVPAGSATAVLAPSR
ncbi:MAG: cadmium-translocating P-type ATPase [Chloroflexi bacterium]|nr:cadmium-translocating P-type ATPase [Chloroflexota bacterium]